MTKTSNPAIDSCRICKYYFQRLIAFFLSPDSPAPADGCIAALIYNPQTRLSEPIRMPTINKPPITYYHVETILKNP